MTKFSFYLEVESQIKIIFRIVKKRPLYGIVYFVEVFTNEGFTRVANLFLRSNDQRIVELNNSVKFFY